MVSETKIQVLCHSARGVGDMCVEICARQVGSRCGRERGSLKRSVQGTSGNKRQKCCLACADRYIRSTHATFKSCHMQVRRKASPDKWQV